MYFLKENFLSPLLWKTKIILKYKQQIKNKHFENKQCYKIVPRYLHMLLEGPETEALSLLKGRDYKEIVILNRCSLWCDKKARKRNERNIYFSLWFNVI